MSAPLTFKDELDRLLEQKWSEQAGAFDDEGLAWLALLHCVLVRSGVQSSDSITSEGWRASGPDTK